MSGLVISGWAGGSDPVEAVGVRPPVGGSPPIPIPTSDPAIAVVYMINYYRKRAGLANVSVVPSLMSAAGLQAIDMGSRGFVGHYGSDGSTPFTRMSRVGYPWSSAGEVVAAVYPGYLTVTAAWMASAPHRAILLGRYVAVGSSVTVGVDGMPRWAVDLATPQG